MMKDHFYFESNLGRFGSSAGLPRAGFDWLSHLGAVNRIFSPKYATKEADDKHLSR